MFTNYTYVYATTGTNTSGVILQEKFLALFKLYVAVEMIKPSLTFSIEIYVVLESNLFFSFFFRVKFISRDKCAIMTVITCAIKVRVNSLFLRHVPRQILRIEFRIRERERFEFFI